MQFLTLDQSEAHKHRNIWSVLMFVLWGKNPNQFRTAMRQKFGYYYKPEELCKSLDVTVHNFLVSNHLQEEPAKNNQCI